MTLKRLTFLGSRPKNKVTSGRYGIPHAHKAVTLHAEWEKRLQRTHKYTPHAQPVPLPA